MFVSTIIPTIGRPTLSRAVESVLSQTFSAADFEVIVVNDSGAPLPQFAWRQSERVRVIATNRRERAVARNTGAAMAGGRFLHFLDDDDWMAPGAWQQFWQRSRAGKAGWLYGVSQLVDRQGKPTIQLHHGLEGNCFLQTMAGEWIPLQASLIAGKPFFDAGGFNALLKGPEDIDLLRRLTRCHEVAAIDAVVTFIERGAEGSTTDYEQHPQGSRWAREKILDETAVFSRLRPAATKPFWWGRIVRLYLTSMVWNGQRHQLLAAASRASYALAGGVLAGPAVLSADFWRALARPYQSETFARGLARAAAGAPAP